MFAFPFASGPNLMLNLSPPPPPHFPSRLVSLLSIRSALLLAVLLLLPLSTQAATLPPYTLATLAQQADGIVIATVTANIPSKRGHHVVTDTILHVSTWIKPLHDTSTPESITLRQRGGTLRDIATVVPGMPVYEIGERVLVYLEAKKTGTFVTHGMWNGKRTLVRHNGIDSIQTIEVDAPILSANQKPHDSSQAKPIPTSNPTHAHQAHEEESNLNPTDSTPLIPLQKYIAYLRQVLP